MCNVKHIKSMMEIVEDNWNEDNLEGTYKIFMSKVKGKKEYLSYEIGIVLKIYWLDRLSLQLSEDDFDEIYFDLRNLKDCMELIGAGSILEEVIEKECIGNRNKSILNKIYG